MGSAVLACVAAAPATRPAGPPTVRAEAVEETRARNAVHVNVSSQLGDELTLRIGYTSALANLTAYGAWHLRQATDDLGTDLRPPPPSKAKPPATTEEFVKLLESATDEVEPNAPFTTLYPDVLKSERDGGATDLKVQLRLGLAPRSATRIARLAGDVTVYTGGQVKTVPFDHPTRRYGHRLDDPALSAAGVTVDLLPADAKPDPNEISLATTSGPHVLLRCRGNLRSFVDPKLQVVGPDGKSATAGFSDAIDADRTDQTLTRSLDRPLDDAMSIRLTVVVGRRSVVVPFDLHDLKLP